MHNEGHSLSIVTNYKPRSGFSKKDIKVTARQFFLLTMYLDEILKQQVTTSSLENVFSLCEFNGS